MESQLSDSDNYLLYVYIADIIAELSQWLKGSK